MNNGFADHSLRPLGHSHIVLFAQAEGLEPPSVLETDALPNELYLWIDLWTLVDSNHILRIFSPAHTPCLPSVRSGSRKIRTFGVFKSLGPLAEGWFRPLTHTSF